ncbi:cytochrome-c peroxidase [Thermaurantimonas aggregans]|uniref:cytochrome-c peroxidase n=1 Tax=Thermaurantimonas aggregans TaxID=2173829 RepID=UPI0023F2A7F8|nr:cytochrome c peroxidase [Thermaurantimonas aggregans]MCX8147665.1 cytochrome-c peroxidase [Thermaurantimonas aggregans]
MQWWGVSWANLLAIIVAACSGEKDDATALWRGPHLGFPVVPYPADALPSEERVALGRKLFFDPGLSIDSTVSCGTCHKPELAFTDGLEKSIGHAGQTTARNAPTLFNVAWHPYFFKEGGNPRLESQMLGPLENPEEMAVNVPMLIDRINAHSEYRKLFKKAYGVDTVDFYHLSRAIATYERTLVSGFSRWDAWYYLGEKSLTEDELSGWRLFTGKAGCISCHNGPDLTDYSLQNIGLHEKYEDVGLFRRTRDSADIGKMKTPTLRNLIYTAPYMHDGSVLTLESVVEHYNSGGKNHPARSPLIRPLMLTDEEKSQLVAILKAFSDTVMPVRK